MRPEKLWTVPGYRAMTSKAIWSANSMSWSSIVLVKTGRSKGWAALGLEINYHKKAFNRLPNDIKADRLVVTHNPRNFLLSF